MLTRDVGDLVSPTKHQNITVGYEVETDGYTLNQFRGALEAEVIKTRITSTVIQNINNLQQKHILENKDFKINFTKLIKREEKIDNDVFVNDPKVIPHTARVFNNKFANKTRQILEKEIRDYNNSDYIHPRKYL